MDYQIAIPSHKRSQTINQRTLRYLADAGIARDRVRVFVAPEQLETYLADTDKALYAEIIPSALGIRENHNFITSYYPDGQLLVRADDDLKHLATKVNDKQLEPIMNLDEWIQAAFLQALDLGATIWGIYPISNPFFMKQKLRTELSFLIGQFFGSVNRHSEVLQAEIKEDYERAILRYITDGAILRMDFMCAVAGGVGKNAGGLQTMDRKAMNQRGTDYLLATYPQYVKLKAAKGNGYPEIRLVNG